MNIRNTLAKWFYSPGAYGLWLALDDVDNWRAVKSGELIAYRSNGLTTYDSGYAATATIYVGLGPFLFNGEPEKGTPKFIGLLERYPLWWKYKKLNNRRMLYRFTKLEQP